MRVWLRSVGRSLLGRRFEGDRSCRLCRWRAARLPHTCLPGSRGRLHPGTPHIPDEGHKRDGEPSETDDHTAEPPRPACRQAGQHCPTPHEEPGHGDGGRHDGWRQIDTQWPPKRLERVLPAPNTDPEDAQHPCVGVPPPPPRQAPEATESQPFPWSCARHVPDSPCAPQAIAPAIPNRDRRGQRSDPSVGRWRCGESNPGPGSLRCRHLRAHPTGVVGRSDPVGGRPDAVSGSVSTRRSRNPGGSLPHCDARSRRGGHPPGGRAALVRQPVRSCLRHVFFFPAL
jgi:hypothetical protein